MEKRSICLNDINPRILGADYYPFRKDETHGPRVGYAHCFIYITSGRGTIEIDRKEYRAKPHDLFYIEPGVRHYFHADSVHPMTHASIYVDLLSRTSPKDKGDMSLCTYRLHEFDASLSVAPVRFTDVIKLPPCINMSEHSNCMQSFLSVIDGIEDQEPGADVALRGKFELFIIPYIRFVLHPHSVADPRIVKVIAWMNAEVQSKFSIAEWSDRLNISAAYLYELFRKETGQSPGQYFLLHKLVTARKLLRETNMTVTDIADYLGFSSLHYLARLFARTYNESCIRYRNRVRSSYEERK